MRYCIHLQTLINQGMSYCDLGFDIFDCAHCDHAEWQVYQAEQTCTAPDAVHR